MTVLRFVRIPGDQPCQHPDCRRNPKGPRPACYRVEIGEARPVVRILCCNHGAALAAEHGAAFPPVVGPAPRSDSSAQMAPEVKCNPIDVHK